MNCPKYSKCSNGATRTTASGSATTLAIAGGSIGLFAYLSVARPRYLRWGTRPEERERRLPGDDIVAQPRQVSNRAVSIDAAPADVWRWLAQIGQGRGGFYSYDRLENLVGADIHSADRILPEHQGIAVGDRIYIGQGGPFYTVGEITEGRYLLLRADAPEGEEPPIEETWLFHIEAEAPGRTRLIARNRRYYERSPATFLMWKVAIEPVHHIMERRVLLGIKERAEEARHA